MTISRRIRRDLGASGSCEPQPFKRLDLHFQRCTLMVRAYYLLSMMFAHNLMPDLHFAVRSAAELDYVWPAMWLSRFDLGTATDVLSFAAFAFAGLAFWKPERVEFRAGFAASFLICGAIASSFGGINHGYHAWIWVAVCFVFLPNGHNQSRPRRLSYCLTFAAAQGLILTFYSLAGAWKFYYGLQAAMNGVEGNLSPRGLALTLADRVMQTGTEPLLADLLIRNYWLAWPMFLALGYAQLVAALLVFRPRLHVAWGLILIAFHTGTWLLMEIWFTSHVMLLVILMTMSPFRRADWRTWQTLAELPLFGPLFGRERLVRPPPAMAVA